MYQLVFRSGPLNGQVVVLAPGRFLLGRSSACEVCIDDDTVSGQHCEILVAEDDLIVRDLGSTNGSYVDDQPVEETVLRPGQALRLGAVELTLEAGVPRIAIPVTPVEPPPPAVLADGLPPCHQHPDTAAALECVQCGRVFCEPCVHQLRRVGGAALALCPCCSGRCRPIVRAPTPKRGWSRFSAWLGKVSGRITTRLQRRRPTAPARR